MDMINRGPGNNLLKEPYFSLKKMNFSFDKVKTAHSDKVQGRSVVQGVQALVLILVKDPMSPRTSYELRLSVRSDLLLVPRYRIQSSGSKIPQSGSKSKAFPSVAGLHRPHSPELRVIRGR